MPTFTSPFVRCVPIFTIVDSVRDAPAVRRLAFVSVRSKMLGAFVGLVLLLGLAGSAHARFTLSGVSQSELDRRALAVGRELESRSGELLLTNDIFGLHR